MTDVRRSEAVAPVRAGVAAPVIIVTRYYTLPKTEVLHTERVRKKQRKVAAELMIYSSREPKFFKIFQSSYSFSVCF